MVTVRARFMHLVEVTSLLQRGTGSKVSTGGTKKCSEWAGR